MPKKPPPPCGRSSRKNDAATEATPEQIAAIARRIHLRRELSGIALMLAAVFIAGSLLAGGAQGGQSCSTAGSIFGPVGSCLRSSILLTLGALSAIIVPFIPAVHALRLLGRIEENEDRRWLFFTIGLAAIVPLAAALARGATIDAAQVDPYAGLIGSFVAFYLVKALGLGGAWVMIALALCALMAGTLAWNPIRMLIGAGPKSEARGPKTDAATLEPIAATGTDGLTRAEHLEPDSKDMPALDMSLMGHEPLGYSPRRSPAEQAEPCISTTRERKKRRKRNRPRPRRLRSTRKQSRPRSTRAPIRSTHSPTNCRRPSCSRPDRSATAISAGRTSMPWG